MGKCPACGAGFLKADYCPECGHVIEEVLRFQLVFNTPEDLQDKFGRFPKFDTVFLPARQAVPEGTLVMLRLQLPVPWGELTVPARVTAMAHTPSTPETPYKLQLTLVQLDQEKKAFLRNIIGEVGAQAPTVVYLPPSVPPTPPAPAKAVAPPLQTRSPETRSVLPAPLDVPPPSEIVPPRAAALAPEELNIDLEDLLKPLEPAIEPDLTTAEEEVEDVEPWLASRERPPEQLSLALTEFVRRLTKALTSTTYYEAEHGYAQQAKVGLYDSFKLLVDDSPEITLLAQISDAKRSILVYGVFEDPTDLDKVMTKGQAELFVPKLAGYFEAKSLLSISFKRSLEHGEFHRFVDLLATPVHLARGDSLDFASALAAQRIQSVSVIFRQDLLSKRKLSWRVAMALTRLKKDLSVLPLYEGRSSAEMRQVRLQVVRDVIRPLRQVHVIRELLTNCDLVVHEIDWLQQEELELMVQGSVTPQVLPELLTGFAQDVIQAVRADPDRAGHLVRVTRNLARKLARSQQDVREAVFRQLHEHDVLSLPELPAALQDKLRIEDKVDVFMKAWSQHLQLFEGVPSAEPYRRHLGFFALIFAELLHRREYDVAVKIALLVARHGALAEGFPGRQALASAWLAELAASAGDEIVRQLLSADKLRRKSLLTLCGVLGEGAVPVLFRALCDCPTRSGRQELCDLLEALKQPTLQFLAAELEKKTIPWYFQRNLINLLGRAGDRPALGIVGRFLNDRHPRVRLEAILSACALDPAGAERTLLRGLADEDPDIRAVSLRQLVQRRSTTRELFDCLRALLGKPTGAGVEAALQACSLLTGYQSGEGYDRAVELLIDVLKDEPRRGFWSRLAGDQEGQEALRIAACQALGRLRARRAVPELSRLADGKDKALKPAASHALRLIQVVPDPPDQLSRPPIGPRPS